MFLAVPCHDLCSSLWLTSATKLPAARLMQEQEPDHKDEQWNDGHSDEQRHDHHEQWTPGAAEPAHVSEEKRDTATSDEHEELRSGLPSPRIDLEPERCDHRGEH